MEIHFVIYTFWDVICLYIQTMWIISVGNILVNIMVIWFVMI